MELKEFEKMISASDFMAKYFTGKEIKTKILELLNTPDLDFAITVPHKDYVTNGQFVYKPGKDGTFIEKGMLLRFKAYYIDGEYPLSNKQLYRLEFGGYDSNTLKAIKKK